MKKIISAVTSFAITAASFAAALPANAKETNIIDDFNSYADNSALLNTFSVDENGDALSLSLTSDSPDGSNALRYDYTIGSKGYSGAKRSIENSDWSSYDGVTFSVKSDGSSSITTLQFVDAKGIHWECSLDISDKKEWSEVEVPFANFKVAPWETSTADAPDLTSVSEFSIFSNGSDKLEGTTTPVVTTLTTTSTTGSTTTTTTSYTPPASSGTAPFSENNVIYASPNGGGDGKSVNSPTDVLTAIKSVEAGGYIYLLEGSYNFNESIIIEESNSGTSSKYKTIAAYPNAKVTFDFKGQPVSSSERGLILDGSYWHFYGFTIANAGDNGMLLSGNNNIIEMMIFENNQDTGLQLSRYNTSYNSIDKWPSNNLVKNCTGRNNCDDATMENADGFAAKLTCGEGNIFDGCIAYNNSDDGFDLYAKEATGPIGVVTIKNCIAARNGFTEDGRGYGDCDGNGFKLGGGGIGTRHIVDNCLAFENLNCGFTDNNNPGFGELKNTTAYNNGIGGKGKANYFVYRCSSTADIENVLTYYNTSKVTKTNASGIKLANDKFKGVVTNSLYYNSNYYYNSGTFTAEGSQAKVGETVTPADSDFITLDAPAMGTDFHTEWRNSDGSPKPSGLAETNGTYSSLGYHMISGVSQSAVPAVYLGEQQNTTTEKTTTITTTASTAAATTTTTTSGNDNNSGKGMYIKGNKLYTADGKEFLMRGMNIAHTWYKGYTFDAIDKSSEYGSNATRIVLADDSYAANGWQGSKDDIDTVEKLIQECRKNGQVAIVEYHNGTGGDDTKWVDNAVSYWLDMTDMLNKYSDCCIVNILNEWQGTWDLPTYAPTYQSAVKKLRDAGLKNVIMIDAPGWGQDAATMYNNAASILKADKDGNTMFSIHMYAVAGADSSTVKKNIDNTLSQGVCLVIGEFGCNHKMSGQMYDVAYQTIMDYSQEKGVGWLAWSWCGNGSDDYFLDLVTDQAGDTLTSWGDSIVNGKNGIKETSVKVDFSNAKNSVKYNRAVSINADAPTYGTMYFDNFALYKGTSDNILYGDANDDGCVTVSDAVAILQYLGNKDKYALTEKGLKNADVYNTGDGVTARDALSIQKLDAGLITSLPEKVSA